MEAGNEKGERFQWIVPVVLDIFIQIKERSVYENEENLYSDNYSGRKHIILFSCYSFCARENPAKKQS
jgi:hypothetical protein